MANKRGRKRTNDLYFGPEQEEAVVKFLSLGEMVNHPKYKEGPKNPLIWVGTKEEEIERNAIYNKFLREPLDKMIESIIRKYKLYRKTGTFEELHSATLSFLITKAHKFEDGIGKKAYSYYGTICKHFILGILIDDGKKLKRLGNIDDAIPVLERKDEYNYELEDNEYSPGKLIKKLILSVEDELNGKTINGKKKINENEDKIGLALIDVLSGWELTLDLMAGGSKFNKISFLENMRNYTGLTTKDIRLGMKRFKKLYFMIKIDGLENGIND